MLAQRNLTAEQRIQKAVVDILHNKKFVALAGVIMIGKREVRESIPPYNTAATNGRDEYYCRSFVDKLSDAELRFLMLHETYHKLFRHLTTWQHLWKENAHLTNVACDHVINLRIKRECGDWARMPEGGCCDSRFEGMDAARVYKILKDEQEGEEGGGGQGGQGQGGEGQPLDHHDWEGAQELSEGEKRELERQIDSAIRQGALMAGTGEGGGDLNIKDLLEPKIDWRKVLREFITETCAGRDLSTWRRPNRRMVGQGVYMPSTYSEKVGELVLAIDTSGSISERGLRAMLSEVKGICEEVKPDTVRLLYWGSSVVRDEVYEQHELDKLIESTKPVGGGGTDVNCVTEYLTSKGIKPQASIVLTDGYVHGWSQWDHPVLWCIVDNKNARPDCGRVVHIDTNDF